MKNLFKYIIFILILGTLIFAQDVDYLFNKANDQYQQENYSEAIKIYHEIINNGKISGQLYYNLGNAYYKVDEIGRAILYYEKSKILMPEDENLRFNLKLANVKVQDRIQVPPESLILKIHQRYINIFSTKLWSLLFSLFVLLTVLVFFLTVLLKKKTGKTLVNIIIVSLVLSMLCLYPTWQKHKADVLTTKAVVLEDIVDVYAAPDGESTMLFNIHEGTLFSILDTDGNWLKIELIDGKQGWVFKEFCGEV